jgi:hypothetical protein
MMAWEIREIVLNEEFVGSLSFALLVRLGCIFGLEALSRSAMMLAVDVDVDV